MLEIGKVVQDRFLIEQRIGLGGMGAVYLATDQKFGSRVAIKQTIYENAELAQAFEREARLLNSLHHPVLPHVSDIFREDGGLLLVMEYIEGEDLSEILKRGETLPIESVVNWTLELLDALDYLHSQEPPIIHRDIKPNNLKVTPRGNIVLLDFGLAKETSGTTQGMHSVFGYSRRYSPLEQIEGTGTDTRSDIFSLGATIFHLLTGEPPIDVLARASAIVGGRPDPLRLATELRPDVPIEFAALIKSAMALNANDRFATAAAMRTAMEHAMSGETPAPVADEPAKAAADVPPSGEDVEVHTSPAASPAPETKRPVVPMPSSAGSTPPAAKTPTPAGRIRSRGMRSRSWQKPALVGLIVLAVAAVSFGLYRSVSKASPVKETTISNQSVEAEALAQGRVAVSAGEQESLVAEKTKETPVSEAAVKTGRPAPEEVVERTTNSPARRPEPEQPAEAAKPVPERARVVKSPKRNAQPYYNDQPPVGSIEQIFTGQPRGPVVELRPMTNKEAERIRRREAKRMRREGQYPPF